MYGNNDLLYKFLIYQLRDRNLINTGISCYGDLLIFISFISSEKKSTLNAFEHGIMLVPDGRA